jgi:hypothetical protein
MKFKQRIEQWFDRRRASRKKFRTYWKDLMSSTQNKISRGAAKIARIISYPRGDNWRRKD